MNENKNENKNKNTGAYKEGHHLNSKYWQDKKRNITELPKELKEILIGCLLGDANMYREGINSKVKMEQGYMHKDYLFHLFEKFEVFIHQEKPYERLELRGPRKGEIKSYSFRTFTHKVFNPIWDLFYDNDLKIKRLKPGLILDHLTERGLAYWIMDDGSKQKDDSMIIHTQGYKPEEVEILCQELNKKFGLSSFLLMTRKGNKEYPTIKIPSHDADILHRIMTKYVKYGMEYKIPKDRKSD